MEPTFYTGEGRSLELRKDESVVHHNIIIVEKNHTAQKEENKNHNFFARDNGS